MHCGNYGCKPNNKIVSVLTRGAALGYFEAQSILSLRLITYFHLLTEVVETKL